MKLKNLLENKQGTFWRVEGKNGFVRRIYEIDPKYITEKDKKRFMSFVNKQPGKMVVGFGLVGGVNIHQKKKNMVCLVGRVIMKNQ